MINRIIRRLSACCAALFFALALAPYARAQQDSAAAAAAQYLAKHDAELQQTANSIRRLSLLMHMAPAALAALTRRNYWL
jgi:hypothetical protein